jgi:hypothetical protein
LALLAISVLRPGTAVFGADEPIHECRDADGNVVYQGEPCPKPPPVAPIAPGAPAKAKPKTPAKPKTQTIPAMPSKPTRPKPPMTRPIPKVEPAGWDTPERALQTFVAAVQAGDRSLVLSCLTSSALTDLGPDADALSMDTLRATVGTFTGFAPEGDVGPFFSIRASRAGTRPKWIFLERTGSGGWKIGVF